MVLDIRYLRRAEGPEPPGASASTPEPDGESPAQALEMTAGPEASGPAAGADLGKLVSLAAGSDDAAERAEAVALLRSLVPGAAGFELLAGIIESTQDERRLVAAQVFGHHRQWLGQRSGAERLSRWARSERDPEVGSALVWAMRNRDSVQEFLLHPIVGMAREAAMGLPVNERTIDALVHTMVVGRSADVDRILGEKLRAVRSGLVPAIVDLVFSWMGEVGSEAIVTVLAHLPQVPLFRIFVQGEGVPQWRADQTVDDALRARQWHQLAGLVEGVLLTSPDPDLVRHLVNHTARDDAFARRYAPFLEAAGRTRAVFSPELLTDLARLTATASNDKLSRLAELLVELSSRLEGDSARRAEALLEEWKTRSPDLKLKIYHLQQGVK